MKMRRILLSLLMFCSLSALAMTDDQVIAYIKQQSAAGKTEQQIGKELLAKGVTPRTSRTYQGEIRGTTRQRDCRDHAKCKLHEP